MAKTVCALIFILIISVPIPSPVIAASLSRSKPIPVTLGGFSLTPTIGGYIFAGSEQRAATQSYGLKAGYDILGKSIADSLGIEGTLNYFTTKSKTDASAATGYLFRLDAIYQTILRKKWVPFLAVGAGGIAIDAVSHATQSPLLNYGAGLKYFFEDYLAVRVDARHILVYDSINTRNNFEFGIGMSYYFGKERKKKPVPPPETKQKDKEDAKDGKKTNGTATKSASAVPALDEIAMSAEGKADEKNKPAVKGETPAAPTSPLLVPSIALAPLLALDSAFKPLFQVEAPKESAGDKPLVNAATPGILPATVAPDKTPPPAGTIPATDKDAERRSEPALPLPLTAAKTQPAPVKDEEMLRQTAGKKVFRKLTINFGINSSYIKPKYHKKLREIADVMKSSVEATARIEGHSDSTGKLSYNIKLSEQRAQSVRSSLITLGVDPNRISIVGYGPSRPIAGNATIKGRQMNRQAVTSVTLIERTPEIKAEQKLLPRINPEAVRAEQSEKERLHAEKLAKASIKAAIMLQEGRDPVSVGGNGTLPFEITNEGANSEEFLLTITAAEEYDAILTRANKPNENITRLQLAPGETFKGAVVFRMPSGIVDGHHSAMMIKAVSTRFSDISFQKETVVISSAPLMRADAKFAKQKVTPGEKLRYRVTVFNAGSMPARNLTVRLRLPPQVEFLGSADVSFKQQPNGTLVFKIDKVDMGTVAEINLDVKIREDSAVGQELRGHVEVVNESLQRKDIFSATASVIEAK